MKYQLVIQMPASSIIDYDVLIEVENALIDEFDDKSMVDGHDLGSGEMNIFVHTDDPRGAFAKVKDLLLRRNLYIDSRIAYRELTDTKYTILWPENLREFNIG